jgi:hypothetical protein
VHELVDVDVSHKRRTLTKVALTQREWSAGVPAGWHGGVSPPKVAEWERVLTAAGPLRVQPRRGNLIAPHHEPRSFQRMRHDNFIVTNRRFVRRSRGRLPHWQLDESTYFVTFRLRDSLPKHIALALFREREQMMRMTMTTAERAEVDRLFGLKLDSHLNEGHGSCIFAMKRMRPSLLVRFSSSTAFVTSYMLGA